MMNISFESIQNMVDDIWQLFDVNEKKKVLRAIRDKKFDQNDSEKCMIGLQDEKFWIKLGKARELIEDFRDMSSYIHVEEAEDGNFSYNKFDRRIETIILKKAKKEGIKI